MMTLLCGSSVMDGPHRIFFEKQEVPDSYEVTKTGHGGGLYTHRIIIRPYPRFLRAAKEPPFTLSIACYRAKLLISTP
jgi:hypothetical protein